MAETDAEPRANPIFLGILFAGILATLVFILMTGDYGEPTLPEELVMVQPSVEPAPMPIEAEAPAAVSPKPSPTSAPPRRSTPRSSGVEEGGVEEGARGEEARGAAMWEALGALKAPCLLVRGMRSSSVVDDADEAELRARLPTARVERLDAGHSVQGDAPVALAQAIASFLPPSG